MRAPLHPLVNVLLTRTLAVTASNFFSLIPLHDSGDKIKCYIDAARSLIFSGGETAFDG